MLNAIPKNSICEIVEAKGYTLKVKRLNDKMEIDGVYLLQAERFKPSVKKGDIGILLDVGAIESELYDLETNSLCSRIYIPFLKSAQMTATENKNIELSSLDAKFDFKANDESADIKSNALNVEIVEALTIKAKNETREITETAQIKAKNANHEATQALTLKSADFTLEATQTALIKAQNETHETKGTFKATAPTISLKSTNPIELGSNAGNLKAVTDALFDAMDALKSSAVVTGQAALTWLPTYDTAKATAKTKIAQIIK